MWLIERLVCIALIDRVISATSKKDSNLNYKQIETHEGVQHASRIPVYFQSIFALYDKGAASNELKQIKG